MNEQEAISAALDKAIGRMRYPNVHVPTVLMDMAKDAHAAGVASATPPTGHIRDDKGVVRKVLGTLPLTADGCVIAEGANVVYTDQSTRRVMQGDMECTMVDDGDLSRSLSVVLSNFCVYATREAADAARNAAGGEA